MNVVTMMAPCLMHPMLDAHTAFGQLPTPHMAGLKSQVDHHAMCKVWSAELDVLDEGVTEDICMGYA